ncbi:hypothetical protein BJ944DRAFT_274312 [Cunninghamella echinulata]|nr:hypothetical protein BJ944DRAFT_274312 [Cunninghamella echinulata]
MITIMTKRSATGLSLASYYLETYAYIIILAYNLRQHNPFSTFGEVVFIASQNVLITLMILWYSKKQPQSRRLLTTTTTTTAMDYNIIWTLSYNFISFLGSFLILLMSSTPMWLLTSLYASTIPIILASKIPQILTNYQNQSTGQLSVFAVINYFAGTTARVFTTLTELDDPLMLAGNILASLLNGVLVLQVYLYWGKSMDYHQHTKQNKDSINTNNINTAISMNHVNNNILNEKPESKAD